MGGAMAHENFLYPKIIEGLRREGVAAFRLGDGSGKTPFDVCGVTADGRFVGVEAKFSHKRMVMERAMPNAWFTDRIHQLTWLRHVEAVGGYGFVFVYEQPTMKYRLLRASAEQDWRGRAMKDLLVIDNMTAAVVGWSQVIG
jgi:penicillin-binding protein-related factor A (putative recombinase)